nr:hypothetical protein [Lysinibacillus sp. JK80]
MLISSLAFGLSMII